MRLAVSNLAFPAEGREQTYAEMRALGVQGVEIAPTRLQPWDEANPDAGRSERRRLQEAGLEASSLQAIFYGQPHLQLLGDHAGFEAMRDHVARLGDYSDALGARAAVFGAPAHRNRRDMEADAAWELGVRRLRDLGRALEGADLVLGIEPIPARYKGDFLETFQEVIAMVRQVDHPKIRLHLDTGCVMLGGGDIAEAISLGADLLVHFQAAEPDLGSFETVQSPHAAAGTALLEVGYDGWVAIEMLEPATDGALALSQAIRTTRSLYPFSNIG